MMNKLAHFVNSMYIRGVKQANAATELAQLAAKRSASSGAGRFMPKSRLGRLGIAAGLGGLGMAALSRPEEPSFSDKAINYLQGIDPATINSAMAMYQQAANPHATMGYSPMEQPYSGEFDMSGADSLHGSGDFSDYSDEGM